MTKSIKNAKLKLSRFKKTSVNDLLYVLVKNDLIRNNLKGKVIRIELFELYKSDKIGVIRTYMVNEPNEYWEDNVKIVKKIDWGPAPKTIRRKISKEFYNEYGNYEIKINMNKLHPVYSLFDYFDTNYEDKQDIRSIIHFSENDPSLPKDFLKTKDIHYQRIVNEKIKFEKVKFERKNNEIKKEIYDNWGILLHSIIYKNIDSDNPNIEEIHQKYFLKSLISFKNNEIIDKNFYRDNIIEQSNFLLNENHQILKETKYNEKQKITQIYEYKYDDYGDVIQRISNNSEGEGYEDIEKYKYTRDKEGNWIKKSIEYIPLKKRFMREKRYLGFERVIHYF